MSDERSDSRWHLDKRVPLALIFTIAIQTGGIIWWAADSNARLYAVEQKIILISPQSDRLTKVESTLEFVREGISEIKQILRRPPP